MWIRRLRAALALALFILAVHLIAVWIAGNYPETDFVVRLAVLLAASKLAGDLIYRANAGPPGRTVYYQDYLVDWFWFGVLAFVGIVFYAGAARLVGRPPPPGPVALGTYFIARATFRRS